MGQKMTETRNLVSSEIKYLRTFSQSTTDDAKRVVRLLAGQLDTEGVLHESYPHKSFVSLVDEAIIEGDNQHRNP